MTDPLTERRDLALDDEAALDRALRIVRAFNEVYGANPTTAKYIAELADKLIAVKHNARKRHQEAENQRLQKPAERQDAARQELERADEAQLHELSQFM